MVSFIHASCKGVCELMTGKMKSVATDLGKNGAKVTMVSITTDPDEDSPAELKAYAKKEGVSGDGFIFLTGQPAAVKEVLQVYGVNQKPGENEMTHVFELFLIAPDGRVSAPLSRPRYRRGQGGRGHSASARPRLAARLTRSPGPDTPASKAELSLSI